MLEKLQRTSDSEHMHRLREEQSKLKADSALNHMLKNKFASSQFLITLALEQLQAGGRDVDGGPAAEHAHGLSKGVAHVGRTPRRRGPVELMQEVHDLLVQCADWTHNREVFLQLEAGTYQSSTPWVDLEAPPSSADKTPPPPSSSGPPLAPRSIGPPGGRQGPRPLRRPRRRHGLRSPPWLAPFEGRHCCGASAATSWRCRAAARATRGCASRSTARCSRSRSRRRLPMPASTPPATPGPAHPHPHTRTCTRLPGPSPRPSLPTAVTTTPHHRLPPIAPPPPLPNRYMEKGTSLALTARISHCKEGESAPEPPLAYNPAGPGGGARQRLHVTLTNQLRSDLRPMSAAECAQVPPVPRPAPPRNDKGPRRLASTSVSFDCHASVPTLFAAAHSACAVLRPRRQGAGGARKHALRRYRPEHCAPRRGGGARARMAQLVFGQGGTPLTPPTPAPHCPSPHNLRCLRYSSSRPVQPLSERAGFTRARTPRPATARLIRCLHPSSSTRATTW